MKPIERTAFEKHVLRRRSLIETVFDQLKNLCQIEHTRHRSMANFIGRHRGLLFIPSKTMFKNDSYRFSFSVIFIPNSG